ncbi:hypothetical protein B0T16DRAFT_338565 [Cercophora newfieldiana]|uniref:RBR-type E3 ubiquitin transferase n=1 Tax=Cercophora newfieldiana TaxID=92897 RepID=A0AA39XRZ2_9PEZI|nr:hypothetical protein B0T16DRAFT_338565 [Cercophora newfieldiana]
MFGQRYRPDSTKDALTTTNRRLKLQLSPNGSQNCVVCTDTKKASEFPASTITKSCEHPPMTCLDCIAVSIRITLKSRQWKDLSCTECNERLGFEDVQRYADEKTFKSYETISIRAVVSESPDFAWCVHGCGDGQLHEAGAAQPVVTCRTCGKQSCFRHKVAWHETLSCAEYDAFLKDPKGFRGANLAMEAAAWKKQEEEEKATALMVSKTTKPCPDCKTPIEKSQGW